MQEEVSVGHVQLVVGGMTCSSCSGSVEKALYEVKGVISAQVNLVAGKAEVRMGGLRVACDAVWGAVWAREHVGA